MQDIESSREGHSEDRYLARPIGDEDYWRLNARINLAFGIAGWFVLLTDVSWRGDYPDLVFFACMSVGAIHSKSSIKNYSLPKEVLQFHHRTLLPSLILAWPIVVLALIFFCLLPLVLPLVAEEIEPKVAAEQASPSGLKTAYLYQTSFMIFEKTTIKVRCLNLPMIERRVVRTGGIDTTQWREGIMEWDGEFALIVPRRTWRGTPGRTFKFWFIRPRFLLR